MKNLIIFGDSYSALRGYIPDTYGPYYPKVDVENVADMWWGVFTQSNNYNLVQNNSWSGTTIGYTGYNNEDCSHSRSFVYRYKTLKEKGFFDENTIDVAFVFGGTNDSWSDAPLGEMKFSNWEEKDLFSVLPAICYLAHSLKEDLKNAKIVFIINTDIKQEIQNGIKEACKYFGLQFVALTDIDKENGHPTKKGMMTIREQVLGHLANSI